LHRYEQNPIIELEDIPFRCNTVFNAASVKFEGQSILLLRVEDLRGRSVFAIARSDDGYNFTVDDEPVMWPAEEGPMARYESHGIEDPRITPLDGTYYIMYTAYGDWGPTVALATTRDFKVYERRGLQSMPVTKNAALFPRKINGRFCRFERSQGGGGSIWVSYSEDMAYWGDHQVVMAPRSDHWDCTRIGAGAPPIETPKGWLEIYHGVKDTSHGPIYRLGAVLLDLEDPAVVLGRTLIPILSPREMYERVGDIGNVVFSCGVIPGDDGTLRVYYGAADTCICAAHAPIEAVLESCSPIENGRLA
jgi:predicted GH43/DUF377 family glycosyl hydrolase